MNLLADLAVEIIKDALDASDATGVVTLLDFPYSGHQFTIEPAPNRHDRIWVDVRTGFLVHWVSLDPALLAHHLGDLEAVPS